jgi:hypothetical protein
VTGSGGDELIRRISDRTRSRKSRGEDAYALLQEAFRGFPVSKLVPLLRSDDSELVEVGIAILTELGTAAAPLLDEVERLLGHESRRVRYAAVEVVHASAGSEDGRTIGAAMGMLDDSDVAVRRAALYFLAHASPNQLSAAANHLGDSKAGLLAKWLADLHDRGSAVTEIAARLDSDDHLERMFAVAAAVRTVPFGESTLRTAARSDDQDIRVFAVRELDR